MNIKKILLYIAILILPFNGFALEITDKSKLYNYNQPTPIATVALYQENSGNTLASANAFDDSSMTEPLADSSNELLTAMVVYLIIIVVYSLYWLRFSSKNYR